MSRLFAIVALAASMLIGAAPARAQIATGDPDLAIAVINTLADVCFQAARGHAPTLKTADDLLLNPVATTPPALAGRFGYIPTWFDLKAKPRNIFVAVGDKPNACHIILADTTQTAEIQVKVATALAATGFRPIVMGLSADPQMNDQIFVKLAPDGYMMVNIHGPRQTVRAGQGDQGAIHVNLMPKALFESLLKRP